MTLQGELEEGHNYLRSSAEMLHLKLQPLETKQVGVVFTPIDYKRVTSLILVRYVFFYERLFNAWKKILQYFNI